MADPKLKLGNDIWATKQKSLLAYNDEGGNFKSLPFQVDRISSGTYVGRNGLIQTAASNEPRVDFTNNTKGALLLEPQRTNLDTNNSFIDNADWSLVDMSRTNEFGVAPDGTNNSTQLSLNSVTGNSRISRAYAATLSSGSTYTFSAYYKGIAGEKAYMRCLAQGGSGTDVNKLITFTGNWQRETLSFVAGSSQNYTYFVDTRVGSDDDATEFEVWGGQLELGTYSTSIIPTSSAAVTRVKDEVAKGGNEYVFNDSEGTLFFDLENFSGNTREITLSNGFTSNRVAFLFYGASAVIRFFVASGGATQADSVFTVNYNFNQRNKVAFRYKQNDFKAYINGTQVFSDTSGNTPVGLSRFDFANSNGTSNFIEGKINQAQIYNEALSDAELATLTTI